MKVSCLTVTCEYNQYMEVVDFSDQKAVSYQVDRRSKLCFYLRIAFDFLNISVVNSKIIYDKMDSTVGISAMDFRFIPAHSMIGKFSNRERGAPIHRPSKKSKSKSFGTVGHLFEFSSSRARCTRCLSEKIENRTLLGCLSCNVPLRLHK